MYLLFADKDMKLLCEMDLIGSRIIKVDTHANGFIGNIGEYFSVARPIKAI